MVARGSLEEEVAAAARAGDCAALESMLFDHGALADELAAAAGARDDAGLTPVHWACRNGHSNCIGILARAGGCDVDARDNDGLTGLMQAGSAAVVTAGCAGSMRRHHAPAARAGAAVVSAMLCHGAELEARDGDGLTAFHWACARGSIDVMEALVRAGCDAAALTSGGATGAGVAKANGRTDLRKRLKKLLREQKDSAAYIHKRSDRLVKRQWLAFERRVPTEVYDTLAQHVELLGVPQPEPEPEPEPEPQVCRASKIERQRCRQFARFQWQKSGASAAAEAEATRIASIKEALEKLRLMALWSRAVAIEVPTERLERAMVDNNPKVAVIALILEAAGKRAKSWPWPTPSATELARQATKLKLK